MRNFSVWNSKLKSTTFYIIVTFPRMFHEILQGQMSNAKISFLTRLNSIHCCLWMVWQKNKAWRFQLKGWEKEKTKYSTLNQTHHRHQLLSLNWNFSTFTTIRNKNNVWGLIFLLFQITFSNLWVNTSYVTERLQPLPVWEVETNLKRN